MKEQERAHELVLAVTSPAGPTYVLRSVHVLVKTMLHPPALSWDLTFSLGSVMRDQYPSSLHATCFVGRYIGQWYPQVTSRRSPPGQVCSCLCHKRSREHGVAYDWCLEDPACSAYFT